jgi:hypothetical protein
MPRHLRLVRKILEVGVPIAFALAAIILSRASIFTFGAALIAAFV